MKMVKSLLLGSAAGLVAVAGAQAADLPVKAKAVEYVKVCSLYGVGYYYIPGTDTCIKIGGYVRYEAYHNAAQGTFKDRSGEGWSTRTGNPWAQHARFRMTMDTRTQTEYGTLRSYISMGFNAHNDSVTQSGAQTGIAFERAFIQFAGITAGRADTFFGFYNGAAYGLIPMALDGSSGPAGHNVLAYTAQFGNGVSATLSLEDNNARSKPVAYVDGATAFLTATGAIGSTRNDGARSPDIVANLRVDQAWGSAQIMGGLHEVGGQYYGANTTANGHPGSEWGWGIGAGLTLKMPWDAKDTLSGVIAYAKGASGFVAHGNSATNQLHGSGGVAVGAYTDAVYGTVAGVGTGLELTETWGGTIAFEHYWTPSLRTSWVFGYLNVSYSDNAKAMIQAAMPTYDPDYKLWRVASRTMWNPVQNLDIGLEVAYSKIDPAYNGLVNVNTAQGLLCNVNCVSESQGYWYGGFRVQRNFWP